MKKVLAILLVVAVMMSSSVAVMAKGVEQNLATDVELQIKPEAEGTFGANAEIKSGETVTLQATVDMSSVRNKFVDVMDLADGYCEGYYAGSDIQTKNAKAKVRAAIVEGTFDLVLTYPAAVKLPASIVNGTALAGFSGSAKNIFTEVQRKVAVGETTSTLTISVKIKKDLNLGTLENNLNTYLADMTFTAPGLAIAKVDSYELSGQLTGSASTDYSGIGAISDGKMNFVKGADAVVGVTVNPAIYAVSGTVANGAGATVSLQGTAFTTTADAEGNFEFADVPNGQYNLVVESGEKKVTTQIEVKGADVTGVAATLPTKNISTSVEVAPGAPEVVVGKVDEATDAIVEDATVKDELDNGGSVEVKVTISDIVDKIVSIVEDIKDAVEDKIDEAKENIKVESLAGVKTEVIVKDNTDTEKAKETKKEITDDSGKKQTMHYAFSYSPSAKSNFVVISADPVAQTVNATYTQVSSPEAATPGTFYVDELNEVIHVFTEEATADFALAYVEQNEIVTDNPNQNEQAPDDNTQDTTTPGINKPGSGGIYNPGYEDDTVVDVAKWPFTDVNAGDWFYEGVAYSYNNGIFKGTTATTFDPNAAITRGMLVTVLGRNEGVSDNSAFENVFTDVASGEYYAAHIAWAAKNKIVTGYGDGNFGPNDIITREQMATIMYRYMQYKGLAKNEDLSAALTYSDASAIADYAVDGVKYCYLKGIMTGKEGNNFDPNGSATRAEVATVMMRIFK